MSKYINADRLIQHLSDWRFGDNLEAFPCNELIEAIENSPAADVVEVVYCKDCKHRDRKTYINVVRRDLFFCNLHKEEVWATEFCSYGDRGGETE